MDFKKLEFKDFLALIVVLSILLMLAFQKLDADIKPVLNTILTLILGYYFGASITKKNIQDPNQNTTS